MAACSPPAHPAQYHRARLLVIDFHGHIPTHACQHGYARIRSTEPLRPHLRARDDIAADDDDGIPSLPGLRPKDQTTRRCGCIPHPVMAATRVPGMAHRLHTDLVQTNAVHNTACALKLSGGCSAFVCDGAPNCAYDRSSAAVQAIRVARRRRTTTQWRDTHPCLSV